MNKSQQIQTFIRDKIAQNVYPPGTQIPTEAELMERFGVSRMTVNKALGVLRNKGCIYSVRGKGTFVKKETLPKNLNELTSFTEEMRRRGIEPITKTLEIAYTSVGFSEEKKWLELEPEDNVYKIVRLRFDDTRPIAMDVTLLNPKVTGTIELTEMGTSLYAFLQEKVNIKINYAKQRFRAMKADDLLAEQLCIPKGDPILRMIGVTYDVYERPFEVVYTYFVNDAYEFEQISRK